MIVVSLLLPILSSCSSARPAGTQTTPSLQSEQRGSAAALDVAASPPEAPAARGALQALGGAVEGGELHVVLQLEAGRVPVTQGWAVETSGSPNLAVDTRADGGRVRQLDLSVSGGTLLVAGRGLRPKVFVESLRFEEKGGIVEAHYRGRGIWRPIVAIFRGVAMSALKKLQWKTDIPSVLSGDVLASGSTAAAAQSPASSPTPSGRSFLDIVEEARITESSLRTFPGHEIALGDLISFQTAEKPKNGDSLRLTITSGSYRPAKGSSTATYEVSGGLEGEIQSGKLNLAGARSTFSHGKLQRGSFWLRSATEGQLETRVGAALFSLELDSGQFHIPGGPIVAVDSPSRVSVHDLALQPDGSYSGVVNAELYGKVGAIERAGSRVAASNVRLHAPQVRVVDGKATGDVDLEFDYRVDYPLVVTYPIAEIGTRRVPLVFAGPFSMKIHLEEAGAGEGGSVTGEYSFKVPWPPVETAALEVLRARWRQDAPVIKRVDFTIEPRRFAPCGGNCFLLDLNVTAEKKSARKSLFRQLCEPEGKADLVVDPATRSFQLRNVRIQPRCKGVVGWVVNFLSPFLTKSYTNMTLFQMPENLPFTIEKVGSGVNWLAIAGRLDYTRRPEERPAR